MDTVDGVRRPRDYSEAYGYNGSIEIHRDAAMYNPPEYKPSEHKTSTEEEEKDRDGVPSGSNIEQKDTEGPTVPEDIPPQPTEYKETNARVLSKKAKTYQLEKFKKNAMIIFNHENVEGYSKRDGTLDDEKRLKDTFSKFNFEIEVHPDCTKVQLFEKLDRFSKRDFTDYGCIAVVILTHGTGNGLLRAKDDGQFYSEMDIVKQFKSRNKPTLLTKPILVLLQACRGSKKNSTEGVLVNAKLRAWKMSTDHEDEFEPYHLPLESDMVVVHSSFAGKPAFRPSNGSWFIQSVCNHIDDLFHTHDLESILTEMKRDIAVNKYYMEYNDGRQEMMVHKQMPVVTSTLIRKLFLRKYKESPPISLPHFHTPLTMESTDDSVFNTPGIGTDSCVCFLDHFEYMKRCLRTFIKEHPKDRNATNAKDLLRISNLENGKNEDKARATLIAISNFLQKHCKDYIYHKYMYFYEGGDELDAIEGLEHDESSSSNTLSQVSDSLVKLSQSNAVRGIGTGLSALVMYSLIKKMY